MTGCVFSIKPVSKVVSSTWHAVLVPRELIAVQDEGVADTLDAGSLEIMNLGDFEATSLVGLNRRIHNAVVADEQGDRSATRSLMVGPAIPELCFDSKLELHRR